jgi:hypothetical protein
MTREVTLITRMALMHFLLFCCIAGSAQLTNKLLTVGWPAGRGGSGRMIIDLREGRPLFKSIGLIRGGMVREIVREADPVFLLSVGKRDLVSQNGWNIFFDKVPLKPHASFRVRLAEKNAWVRSAGSRTIISIGNLSAGAFNSGEKHGQPDFTGRLEITLYHGSTLFNIAAVMTTRKDSVAILYDAGLVSKNKAWDSFSWADTEDRLQTVEGSMRDGERLPDQKVQLDGSGLSLDTARSEAVKYRTIIGTTKDGSIAVFPPPHQYFYPLDEAFNLRFVWHGGRYRGMTEGIGLGIRQDLDGDHRYVPWFNAPPGTAQRLNFFCLLSAGEPAALLDSVKNFTHGDRYIPLAGYHTMSSHFHNEYVMKVLLAGRGSVRDTSAKNDPGPVSVLRSGKPDFVRVFERMGIDIVHLAEFHYTAHPKGPDEQRLKELDALFGLCRSASSDKFLLLPGEEPNEFFGGHWLEFFPRPVYWIMSRKKEDAFVADDPVRGKVYHIGNASEMLQLLEQERGLAWTAHPRTKGSTGFPDVYRKEGFFRSDRFLGAAWKAMPADLSQPRLGKRVLDLMDDMNNWGVKKQVLSEADLFTVTAENEMYAHLNVNYLKLAALPSFEGGWQPVLDVLRKGDFFSTTGEVLIPAFLVNSGGAGDTVTVDRSGKTSVSFKVRWTFPLNFAEIISGDGEHVYRDRIDLGYTRSYGERTIRHRLDLRGRKWARLEVWDVAANGAFTQTVWLNGK